MNNTLKWTIIGGLFLIPFTPLIVSSGLMFPFITGKAFFFRIIVDIIFALYLILAVIEPEYRPKKSWITYGTIIFLGIVLVADTFGINPHKSFWSNFERMEGFFMILHLWMFYVVASVMLIKRHWDYILYTSVGASIIAMWYGLFQFVGKIDIRQGAERLDSTLGNATYFAVYILLNLGFTLYLYLQKKDHKENIKGIKNYLWYGISTIVAIVLVIKVFPYFALHLPIPTITEKYNPTHTTLLMSIGFWAVISGFIVYFLGFIISTVTRVKKYSYFLYLITLVLMQLYLIVKTATRGTILGIAAALFISSVLYVWKSKEDKVGRIVAACILALVILSGVTLFFSKNTNFVKNNSALNRIASISLDNARTKYIWPIAFQGIKENPLLGYGQDGFNYAFNKYYNPKMWTEESWFDRAHNVFLDWFVAAGLLGFLSYISLYVLSFWYIWKGKFSFKEKIVLNGLMIAYAIHNMLVFDNIASYIVFFTILAFLHYNNAEEPLFKKININVDIRDLIIIPGISIVCLALLYFVNIVPIKVGGLVIDGIRRYPEGIKVNLSKYEELISYNVTGSQEAREQAIQNAQNIIINSEDAEIKQQAYALAKKAIDQQIAYAPLDARGYIIGGEFLNKVGQFADAEKLLDKAHELTPKKQTPLFDKTIGLLNQGKNKEALAVIKTALDLDPSYPEAQNLYIIALLYNDKLDELDNFIKENPPGSTSEQLVSVFLEKKQFGRLITIMKSLVNIHPEDWRIRKSLAAAYYKAGDNISAIKTIEDTMKEFPGFEAEGKELIRFIKSGGSIQN